MGEKLRLYGFNNLTKALSFNIYDVCYAKTPREQRDYIAYIDEQYNSERLTNILTLSLIHISPTGTSSCGTTTGGRRWPASPKSWA